MDRASRAEERATRRAQRIEDTKYWTPIVSAFVGAVALGAGIFVSSICTRYGPGENGCIEYGNEMLGRIITLAGLVLLISGLYVVFTPYVGWPFVQQKH